MIKANLSLITVVKVIQNKYTIVEEDISAVSMTPFLLPSSPTQSEDDRILMSSPSCYLRPPLRAPDVLGSGPQPSSLIGRFLRA